MRNLSKKKKIMALVTGICILALLILLGSGIYFHSVSKIPDYQRQYTQEEWQALPLEKQQEISMWRKCNPRGNLRYTDLDCSKYKEREKQ